MSDINRGVSFLLTETVTINRLTKSIKEVVIIKEPAFKNISINLGRPLIRPALVNIPEAQLAQARPDNSS